MGDLLKLACKQGGNAPQASMQIPRQSGAQAASSGMNHLHHDYSSHYPQPEFNDIAGTSLSDRMGGFDLGKGNSVFANLLHPRDSDVSFSTLHWVRQTDLMGVNLLTSEQCVVIQITLMHLRTF